MSGDNNENKEKNNKKLKIIVVVFLFIIGVPIVIYLINLLIIFGMTISFGGIKDNAYPIVIENFTVDFKDILNIYVVMIGVFATSVFSYLMWKSNEKSVKISEELKKLEKQRDRMVYKDVARCLYYSLESYLLHIYKKEINVNDKIIITIEEWRRNIEKLYGKMSIENIKYLYDLYFLCNKYGEDGSVSEIKGMSFDENSFEYIKFEYKKNNIMFKSITPLLNIKCYLALLELKSLFEDEYEDKIKLDSILCNGDYKVDYSKNKLFCEIKYKNYELTNKKVYSSDGGDIIENCAYKKGKIDNGDIKIYSNEKLIFEGKYKDGERYYGKEYMNGELVFDGDYKDGEKYNGYIIKDMGNKMIFVGKYKDGKKLSGKEYINKELFCELVFEGKYKDGERYNGYIVIEKKTDRGIFKGEYKDGEIYYGKEYVDEQLVFEGEYKEGKYYNGVLAYISKGFFNNIFETNIKYKDGAKNGYMKRYHENGKVFQKFIFKNNKEFNEIYYGFNLMYDIYDYEKIKINIDDDCVEFENYEKEVKEDIKNNKDIKKYIDKYKYENNIFELQGIIVYIGGNYDRLEDVTLIN